MATLQKLLAGVERGTSLIMIGVGANNNGDDVTDGPVETICAADQHDDWDEIEITPELAARIERQAKTTGSKYGTSAEWIAVLRVEMDDTGRQECLVGYCGKQ